MMGYVGFHQEFYCLTWVKKKNVSSFNVSMYNNLVVKSVFKVLKMKVKNLFPYEQNEWDFYFWSLTVAPYKAI